MYHKVHLICAHDPTTLFVLVGKHLLAHLEKLAGKAVKQGQVICVMTIVAAIQMIPFKEYYCTTTQTMTISGEGSSM